MKTKFAGLPLEAVDLEETAAFYIKALGYIRIDGPEGRDPKKAVLVSPDGRRLLLTETGKRHEQDGRNFHFCFDTEDISAMADKLHEMQIPVYPGAPGMSPEVTEFPFHPTAGKCGCPGFFLNDPSGNVLEFHELTERSLQIRTPEEIEPLIPLIRENEYIPEAVNQGD